MPRISYQNGKLGSFPVRVRHHSSRGHHALFAFASLFQGYQVDLAIVIYLGEQHQHGMGKGFEGAEKTIIDAGGRQSVKKLHQERSIFRFDRADKYGQAAGGNFSRFVLFRVRADDQMERREANCGLQRYSCIHDNRFSPAHNNRVHVQLHDFRKINYQLRQPQDHLFKVLDVCRSALAVSFKEGVYPGFFHEPSCQGKIERRKA